MLEVSARAPHDDGGSASMASQADEEEPIAAEGRLRPLTPREEAEWSRPTNDEGGGSSRPPSSSHAPHEEEEVLRALSSHFVGRRKRGQDGRSSGGAAPLPTPDPSAWPFSARFVLALADPRRGGGSADLGWVRTL